MWGGQLITTFSGDELVHGLPRRRGLATWPCRRMQSSLATLRTPVTPPTWAFSAVDSQFRARENMKSLTHPVFDYGDKSERDSLAICLENSPWELMPVGVPASQ